MSLSSDYRYHLCCKMSNSILLYRLIMGEVTWLTWPQMTCMKTRDLQDVSTWGFLVSENFILLRKIVCLWQRCNFATFCDRAEVYLWHHSHRWHDLTWKWKRFKMSDVNGGSVMPSFSSPSPTAPERPRENCLGGGGGTNRQHPLGRRIYFDIRVISKNDIFMLVPGIPIAILILL